MHVVTDKMPPLIAVVGHTAVGKSALGLRLCEAFSGEIVTADSRQVYRLMDIGTDKPSSEDQARVPHHMIDLVMPDEPYTLADYQQGAYGIIDDVLARGKVPFLVGGTPLYTNAVLEGWSIPRVAPDAEVRARLEREVEEQGPEQLHARLREVDPAAAERILPSNARRIIRALEVIEATGKPISEQQGKAPPPYRMLIILLDCERGELYRRIDARVDGQIERGLVEEVAHLHSLGYAFDLPSMSGLGYRQIGAYLMGRATLAEAVQRIKWDTHAFARHQGNWFRRLGGAITIDTTHEPPYALAIPAVQLLLENIGELQETHQDRIDT
jgi:tRNA dimethylallyltransferase